MTSQNRTLRDFGSSSFKDAGQPHSPVRDVTTLLQYDTIAACIAVMASGQRRTRRLCQHIRHGTVDRQPACCQHWNTSNRRRLRSASSNQLDVPSFRLPTVGSRAFPTAGAKVVTSALSLSTFRRHLKTYLFRCCYNID